MRAKKVKLALPNEKNFGEAKGDSQVTKDTEEMKKEYMKPETEAIEIDVEQMIAATINMNLDEDDDDNELPEDYDFD